MVAGPVDVGLLTVGLGGLVAFGPFGRAVLGRLVGEGAGPLAWSIWVGVVGLWALVLAGSASFRVTVYHVDPEELDRAVRDALDGPGGPVLADPQRLRGRQEGRRDHGQAASDGSDRGAWRPTAGSPTC